jgi:hypothetical protein
MGPTKELAANIYMTLEAFISVGGCRDKKN